MSELQSQLVEVINQAKEAASNTFKMDLVHDQFVTMIEGFLYGNMISVLLENLTD